MNYPVHGKEMFALVDALDDWRHYVFGAEIHISPTILPLRTSRTQLFILHGKFGGWKSFSSTPHEECPHSMKTNTTSDALSRNNSLKEEVIEIGKPPPLDLAFLGAVDISTSPSVYIQPSVFAPLSAEPSW